MILDLVYDLGLYFVVHLTKSSLILCQMYASLSLFCEFASLLDSSVFLQMVEAPSDIVSSYSAGASIASFPYIENVRSFLSVIEQLQIPTFEPSDLDKVEL